MSDSQPTPADPGAPRHPSADDDAPDDAAAPDQTPAAPEAGTSTSRRDPLRGSRTSGVWLAVVAGGVILVLLIIFIAQNTDTVRIRFLGWEGETPLAVALLIATTAGLFLAAVAGSLRILQLRRRVRRDKR